MTSKKPKKRQEPIRNQEEQRVLKKLGTIISTIASQKKIGLKQLAYEAGVSKGFIYDLVKGKANPTVLLLRRIAETGDTSLEKLLKGL